ncbi:hypothetical protein LTR10_021150 [Elasticomyces elasticus]|uniref:Major facilitator superfamily (MFS) profile domain-containing protein n=1 Tax=Exophiala sideris TaxID=1016849 RepID=A0ABR0JRS8_9EURO|nr:hypothetical protein LTR10_021150 [Elasticomyces elasticus]KAK5040310.1 hypothetical protein LTS07_000808 [Exophiala sideris]KAK5043264.1 hypothetical protein LTR13_001035 [Exophiala sideris]KAK5068688.1 hypothetical protein LTR69_000809 [Exophiala sideris]KAK5186286.1 hypothetical protein LTR44_001342 [Eurotiomycetes sp. CCFEE 6388]
MASLIPGTVQAIDVRGTFNNVRHAHGQQDTILIPQPSADPEDPLNWSDKRKLLNVISQCLYTFCTAIMIASLSSAYLLMEKDTGISLANINTGTGLEYLFLGWCNVFWQPIAINYGRRPVLLISMVGTCAISLWTACVKSTGEWYANRILQGFFLAPIETLVEICIADIFFSHQRARWMATYTWTLFCGPFLGPVAAGFVADRFGWQWVQYVVCCIGWPATLIVFFTLEETMFFRRTVQEEALIEFETKTSDPVLKGLDGTKSPDTPATTEKAADTRPEAATGAADHAGEVGSTYPRKSYRQKLKVWGFRAKGQPNTFLKDVVLPFTLVRFPAMVFAGLLVGSILSWFNVVNGTVALILGSAPYSFSAEMIGVAYISCVIGVSVGCFLSGHLSDWIARYMARRNNGVREPEHRLWLALIPMVIHPVGCILYGVGAAHHVHWVGVLFGLGLICVCLPMGTSVAFNYIMDCYKEVAGEGIVTAILFRNTMGFAFAYAVVPMINGIGLQDSFILLAFLGMGFWGLSLPMIMFGKTFRKHTAMAYWRMVEQHGLTIH